MAWGRLGGVKKGGWVGGRADTQLLVLVISFLLLYPYKSSIYVIHGLRKGTGAKVTSDGICTLMIRSAVLRRRTDSPSQPTISAPESVTLTAVGQGCCLLTEISPITCPPGSPSSSVLPCRLQLACWTCWRRLKGGQGTLARVLSWPGLRRKDARLGSNPRLFLPTPPSPRYPPLPTGGEDETPSTSLHVSPGRRPMKDDKTLSRAAGADPSGGAATACGVNDCSTTRRLALPTQPRQGCISAHLAMPWNRQWILVSLLRWPPGPAF